MKKRILLLISLVFSAVLLFSCSKAPDAGTVVLFPNGDDTSVINGEDVVSLKDYRGFIYGESVKEEILALGVKDVIVEFDSSYPYGTYLEYEIIGQNPSRGFIADYKNRTITLTVYRSYEIPDLTNKTYDEAEALCEGNFIFEIYNDKSDDVEENRIIRTEPEAGTHVSKNSTVILYISTGLKTVYVDLPDGIFDMYDTETVKALLGDTLEVEEKQEYSAYKKGTVIRIEQDGSVLSKGDNVIQGSRITLVVSDGQDPEKLVIDAYNGKVKAYNVRIPKININYGDAETINKQIWDSVYVDFIEKYKDAWDNEDDYLDTVVSYSSNVVDIQTDSILTLSISVIHPHSDHFYSLSYTVSLNSGQYLIGDDIPKAMGYTADEFNLMVRKAAGSSLWAAFQANCGENASTSEINDFNDDLDSVSGDDYLNNINVYLNSKGHLTVDYYVSFTPVGYVDSVDLDDYIYLDYYDRKAVKKYSFFTYTVIPESYTGYRTYKDAYKEYIAQFLNDNPEYGKNDFSFCFIYLNKNNIPLLYICGESKSAPAVICSFDGVSINELSVNSVDVVQYVYSSSRIYVQRGPKLIYDDCIYDVIKGRFELVASGERHYPDEPTQEFEPTFSWEGQLLSEEDYLASLNAVFNEEYAETLGADMYSYNEIMNILDN